MEDCCIINDEASKKRNVNLNTLAKKCIRKTDGKVFVLPRRFTRKQCKKQQGYSMKASCAPFKDCFTKKKKGGGRQATQRKKRKIMKNTRKSRKNKRIQQQQFLYNPDNPKKSFDVYIDKNPKDTIHIKYKTVDDVKNTIQKLERLYKSGKYPHKRIWQVGMIMKVRLEVLKSTKPKQYILSKNYFEFLGRRTKIKTETQRRKMKFNLSKV